MIITRKFLLHLIWLIVLFFAPLTAEAGMYPFKTSSVLAEGKFVKIRIKESGVYRLTFEDLNSMGITPANVRIFGYGGAVLKQNFSTDKYDDLPEVTIHMEKGADGVFNSGDYILFYAQGVNSWSYDLSRGMFTHVLNYYANHGHYFVTSDAGTGRTIEATTVTVPDGVTVNPISEFVDYAVYEKELISLATSGKEFYGEVFGDMLSLNINMTFPNVLKTANAVKARLDVAALSSDPSSFQLTLHGGQQKNLTIAARTPNDNYEKGRAANGVFTFTPTADLLNFNLTYQKSNSSSKAYLNYLVVNARRELTMSGSSMRIQNVDFLGSGTFDLYTLSNAGSKIQIWDITDPVNTTRMPATLNDGKLQFHAPNTALRTYLAIDPSAASSFPKPEVVGAVANQNLHAMPRADLFIITHPLFLAQAQRLAQEHNDKGEITAAVVTTEQIYNEFSSGNPDATAYRWFLKMFYDRANDLASPALRPKYLLLFGRGSFDNRKVLPTSSESFVLTYQTENSLVETLSYVTDDYFAFLDDWEGNQVPAHSMDVGVGRFPVTSVQEATDVVNKSISYMRNTRKGIWKNQLLYLADDGDGALHMRQADSIASMISRANPAFQMNKIYLDAYQQEVNASGESYPVARAQFLNLVRKGVFLLDFVGHAGATGWTNEQILSNADVKNLSNANLPLWVGATCNFLQYDIPSVSAGEQVLLNPVGGGIGIISAARPVYASQNMNINKLINQFLFVKENGKHLRLGDVLMRAKNGLGTEINKLSYVLMGDPALRLNYPTEFKVVTTRVNGVDAQSADTLRALSLASLAGHIADQEGNIIPDFNGYVQVNVYDKVQRITTLNNDKNGFLTYNDRPNTLFSGVAAVKDGEFIINFMLPKDIRYNYGSGRVNYYAYDSQYDMEAQGFFENFVVGGSNTDFVYETDGPEIKMYLNSPDFVNGGKVNETPVFFAEISDINGINQIGSGIGHDMMLVVDEDPGQTYILNEFYESALNDYTKGTLRFKLPELRSGKHTLRFRAWDLLNNSSVKTIEFEVVKGLQPQILNIYNYPNPVKQNTRFVIEHDRPETVLDATIDIYDTSGRRVWTFKQSTLDEISWDASDSFGKKLKTGVYMYRISIQTSDKQVYSKMNKLMIIE
jgi:hypothetical protein